MDLNVDTRDISSIFKMCPGYKIMSAYDNIIQHCGFGLALLICRVDSLEFMGPRLLMTGPRSTNDSDGRQDHWRQ